MSDNFENFEINDRRRSLLPWWIKFFCWLFMFASGLLIVRVILTLFNINSIFEFYGLNANDGLLNAIIVFIVFALHGLTGYSLWFEKKQAVFLGQIDAIIGILLCVFSMILSYINGGFVFRAELLLLILFLFKLNKIKSRWSNVTD